MLLNCACILVRVLEKTGFLYFIFHRIRKPLHWDGHALALVLSVLALLTSLPIPDRYLTIHEWTRSGTSRVKLDRSSVVAKLILVIGMVELI